MRDWKPPKVEFKTIKVGNTHWCNTHNRFANCSRTNDGWQTSYRCCCPGQSGIMIPCNVVNIVGLLDIEED